MILKIKMAVMLEHFEIAKWCWRVIAWITEKKLINGWKVIMMIIQQMYKFVFQKTQQHLNYYGMKIQSFQFEK
jgi:hypothetical protein